MASRLSLQQKFEELLGTRNVYFQPPASIKLQYDAIVYSRDSIENRHANDSVYKQDDAYKVMVIYTNPDSDLPRKISQLPKCSWVTHYTVDKLYHDVFKLYY